MPQGLSLWLSGKGRGHSLQSGDEKAWLRRAEDKKEVNKKAEDEGSRNDDSRTLGGPKGLGLCTLNSLEEHRTEVAGVRGKLGGERCL